jgi:D-arabinose 1-dehydrogenase-like Zn-dependent alcohol dehydrogenase
LLIHPFPDTGAEKKELCLKLGAEKWIDFNESKNLVKDVKDACDGLGPHCALVTSATVRHGSLLDSATTILTKY